MSVTLEMTSHEQVPPLFYVHGDPITPQVAEEAALRACPAELVETIPILREAFEDPRDYTFACFEMAARSVGIEDTRIQMIAETAPTDEVRAQELIEATEFRMGAQSAEQQKKLAREYAPDMRVIWQDNIRPASPEDQGSVSKARDTIMRVLKKCGVDPEIAFSVTVVASEFITNEKQASPTGGRIWLGFPWMLKNTILLVTESGMVFDKAGPDQTEGQELLAAVKPRDEAAHGRGLILACGIGRCSAITMTQEEGFQGIPYQHACLVSLKPPKDT